MKSTLRRFAVKALPAAPLALAALPSAEAIPIPHTPATGIVYTDVIDATHAYVFVTMGDPTISPGQGDVSTSTSLGATFAFYSWGTYKGAVQGIGASGRIAGTSTDLFCYTIGNTIGASSAFQTQMFKMGGNPLDSVSSSSDNYLGVSFNDTASNVYYGWIRVSQDVAGSNTMTVYDFAYNATPGASILAGQTSAIPEPSTYAMLAGLLAGSTVFYRRRQQNKAAA